MLSSFGTGSFVGHCLARGRAAQRFDIVVAIARRRIGARLIPAVFVGVWEASLDEVDAVGVIDGQAAIGQRNCTVLEEELVMSSAFDALVDVVQHARDARWVSYIMGSPHLSVKIG